MRNYIKLQVVKLVLTQNGGNQLATRYFCATDEEQTAELVAQWVGAFQLFANVDLPPTVIILDRFFKMNQLKVVTMLTGNGFYLAEAPAQTIWNALELGVPGLNPELTDFIRANFVEKSPRKKGRHG